MQLRLTPIAFSLTTREASVGNRDCSPSATRQSTTAAANSTTIRRISTNKNFNWLNGSQHRLRFDRERRPYFHYGLGAHTRGTGILPCLTNPGGNPTGYFEFGICADPNDPPPNQHDLTLRSLPTRFLHLRGGSPICLGVTSWQRTGYGTRSVGRPYTRAVTIFHELGHNLYLWHSGVPAHFGDAGQATVIEANCKPNLITSMNYLYKHQGLFDLSGHIQLDFSHGALPVLQENALADGASLTTPPYRRAWYAPFYLLGGDGIPLIDPNTHQKISARSWRARVLQRRHDSAGRDSVLVTRSPRWRVSSPQL